MHLALLLWGCKLRCILPVAASSLVTILLVLDVIVMVLIALCTEHSLLSQMEANKIHFAAAAQCGRAFV